MKNRTFVAAHIAGSLAWVALVCDDTAATLSKVADRICAACGDDPDAEVLRDVDPDPFWRALERM